MNEIGRILNICDGVEGSQIKSSKILCHSGPAGIYLWSIKNKVALEHLANASYEAFVGGGKKT